MVGLPGMAAGKVEKRLERLRGVRSPAQGAAVVLEMLQGVRGVSIYELGKMERPGKVKRKASKGNVNVEMAGVVTDGIRRGGEEELEGVAGMFG